MRKNIVVSIILIIAILINTVSYAFSGLSVETLEDSLRELTSKNIEITAQTESGTSNTKMDAQQVEIGDSKIVIKEAGTEDMEPIVYSIENNICKFEYTQALNISENTTQEEALQAVMMTMLQKKSIIEECYLAVADAIGKDLSLAYTYYAQKSAANNGGYSIVDEVFKMQMSTSQTEVSAYLEINLEKMDELTESDIDSSSNYTVKLIDLTEGGTNDGQGDTPSGEQGGNGGNNPQEEVKTENQDTPKEDTQPEKDIPKAGKNNNLYIIVIMAVVMLMLYIKNKKYEDIK